MESDCKLLIIDDEIIMRQGIKYLLDWEKEGFQITGEASGGKEGLELVDRIHPHIILCDMVMSGMDGVEFTEIVKKKYPDIQIIILSGYDNFEYVRSSLMNGASDYILKPMLKPESLLETLRRAAKKIPGFQFQMGSHSSKESLLERYLLGFDVAGEELKKYFPHSFFRLYGAKLKGNPINRRNTEEYEENMDRFLLRMDYGKYVKLLLNGEMICILWNYDARDEERLETDFQKLTEKMIFLDESFFGVLGCRRENLKEIRDEYRQNLLEEVGKAFYSRDVHFKILDRSSRGDIEKKKFDFNSYTKLLGSRRYEEALSMLETYLNHALEERMDEYKLKNITKNMLYSLFTILEEEDERIDELRLKYFKRLDRAEYETEFREILSDVLQSFQKIISDGSWSNDRRIREILEYIGNHYREELDLKEVAKVFNFNYYYLSAYFNSNVNEGFSGYLNRIRTEQACRILEKESFPISEVSGMVGYSDHSYFCRVFKKIIGKTPSRYRQEKRNEERQEKDLY